MTKWDSLPTSVPDDWHTLLASLPGYDPFLQADGCRFDKDEAVRVISFFSELLQHVEGEMSGKPFELERWQQAILANLFGWKRIDDYGRLVRRYREAYLEVGRKNGKSPLVAGVALYVLFCDGEAAMQGYVAAGDREQAGFLFRQAKGMVEREPLLNDKCDVYGGNASAGQSKSIVLRSDGGFLRVISADADTKHGQNTHLAIIDELHVQPNRNLVTVLETSMASKNRKQPLFISITTAGHDRESICWEKYQQACRVRDNKGDKAQPGYNPAFLPVIYETSPDADWTSEEVWAAANPNLGVSVSLEYLRNACRDAKEIPDKENEFRQLHLDQWCQQAVRWLSMHAWEQCGKEPIPDLTNRVCYAGLDLASTQDTTACVLLFPDDDDGYYVLPTVWVPSATKHRRASADSVPYDTWVRMGLMRETGGDWCDYAVVEKDLCTLAGSYRIDEIAFDPREASMLSQRLMEKGHKCLKFEQTYANYNEPVKMLEKLIGERKIRHGNHAVLNWMAGNVALRTHRTTGWRMPAKGASGDKIDGIVALLMALAVAMRHPRGSWYRPGVLRN